MYQIVYIILFIVLFKVRNDIQILDMHVHGFFIASGAESAVVAAREASS
jgi:hypothetical protein